MKTNEPLVQQNWTVVYVASRQEKVVARRLAQLNVEHYLPLVKKLRKWADRRKVIEVPLFNSYIFVKPVATQHDTVLQIPGVVGYVRFNGKPAVIRNEEITTIERIIAHGYDVETVGIPAETPPGSRVRIIQGVFSGLTGELLEALNGQHFLIVLEGIKQGIKIKMPPEVLQCIKL